MKRKETVSGKIVGYLLAIGMLVALAAGPAAAWKITFKNDIGRTVKCFAEGDHLFWRQQDCSVDVKDGETKDCVMPGGICPTYVCCAGVGEIYFYIAQCWDHSYKVTDMYR